ncbi:MAG: L-aspartate oxidase [Candidatus Gastranaerophilales bacterium]|nr:L-aspartate oxidase [Candidatus Gastranaerophilales bacterium]
MRAEKSTIIIIGSGISGLYTAISLAEKYENIQDILLVTKSHLRESNTRYAQGGIVAVLPENKDDSVSLHIKDTLKAGAGLSEFDTARLMAQNSAKAIKELINHGVEFDKTDQNDISLTLEAAHSVRRVLHSGGDATGKNIELVLADVVQNNPKIKILQETQVVDLLINDENECKGAVLFDEKTKEYKTVYSNAVVIATGGIGQIYTKTTNPKVATGDGIALAYRANAVVQDIEFVQFHPTGLSLPNSDNMFLISEAVRGEGAKLRNKNGELFTQNYDRMGDLAPRDIVARAIFFEMQKTNSPNVYLDTTFIDKNLVEKRFPNIANECKKNNIDIKKDYIPVAPAAHYSMGGIKVSLEGKTNIQGLFAIGEASCSGLHGANRLASNSLLECTVAARELAAFIGKQNLDNVISKDEKIQTTIDLYDENSEYTNINLSDLKNRLKQTMWNNAGIIRNQNGLIKAFKTVEEITKDFNRPDKCQNIEEYEFRNMLTVAKLIVCTAMQRKESRGAHYREDFPQTSTKAIHSYIKKGEELNCPDTCTIS